MKSLKILSQAPSTRRTDLDRWQSLIRHESGTPRLLSLGSLCRVVRIGALAPGECLGSAKVHR